MPKRRVIESAAFLADLEAIGPAGYDWTERREGIRFLLSGGAEKEGRATQDTDVRIYLQDAPDSVAGIPGLKVFYVVEGETVTILRGRGYEMATEG
ncbi:MAG TPA: hypothetical protein VF584_14235 [Longimicrobium sp.]|jgi:hypothetical protein